MKLHYYPETDSLYIELRDANAAETREIADGANADFGEDGNISWDLILMVFRERWIWVA